MKITILLLMNMALIACFGQTIKNDLKSDNLKGNVKLVSEKSYAIHNNSGVAEKGALLLKTVLKYDSKGNNVEQSFYQGDGILNIKFTTKFEAKGKKLERIYYKPNGTCDYKVSYKNDARGNEMEETKFNSDNSLDNQHHYKYDDANNKIEDTNIDNEGNIIAKVFYKYDSKGNIMEENHIEADGSLLFKCFSKYDEKGNVIEFIKNRPGMKDESKETYTYPDIDKNGNWIKRLSLINGKSSIITEREIIMY